MTICTQPVTLHAGYWFNTYSWQDGSADSVYTITAPGRYILHLGTQCGTELTDTVDAFDNKLGSLGMPSVCQSDTITLRAPGGLIDYSWGPDYELSPINDSTVNVYPKKNTFYILSSATTDGCLLKDTIPVTVRQSPLVNLGPDTVVCQQEKLILRAGSGFQSYAWSTGDVSPAITVGSAGQYSVLVTDQYGCTGLDTTLVGEKVCADRMIFPNAFTPDGNGINDLFKPFVQGQLEEYELQIFNRWGEVLFRTSSASSGWDGRRNGVIQSPGVYAWICQYKFSDDGKKISKGTLELIR